MVTEVTRNWTYVHLLYTVHKYKLKMEPNVHAWWSCMMVPFKTNKVMADTAERKVQKYTLGPR